MLVVSDVDDVFLPKPTDLLINLTEARQSLESLLGRINDMFQDNHTVGSAMGPALQAGFKLMVSRLMKKRIADFELFSGSYWWQDYGTLIFFAKYWRWFPQKP
jgi:hypothetical protein